MLSLHWAVQAYITLSVFKVVLGQIMRNLFALVTLKTDQQARIVAYSCLGIAITVGIHLQSNGRGKLGQLIVDRYVLLLRFI